MSPEIETEFPMTERVNRMLNLVDADEREDAMEYVLEYFADQALPPVIATSDSAPSVDDGFAGDGDEEFPATERATRLIRDLDEDEREELMTALWEHLGNDWSERFEDEE